MISIFKHPRLAVRLGIDGAMVLLFVTSLAFRITGREMHEWVGVLFCLLVIPHVVWNWGWFKNMFRGKYPTRRIINATTNWALVAVVIVLFVCGVMNSRYIFGFSHFVNGENVRRIHCFTAYWGVVFIGIHTGLHWEMILSTIRRARGSNREIKTMNPLLRVSVVCFTLLGVWASYDRDMASKLFMGFSFDFWDPSRPLVLLFVCNLLIMFFFGVVARYIQKCLRYIPRPASKMFSLRR